MTDKAFGILALRLVPGLGDRNIKQLISYCGGVDEVFKTPKGKLSAIPGFGEKTAEIIAHSQTKADAEKIVSECEQKGMNLLSHLDKKYPNKLKTIIDAPCLLFTKGKGHLNYSRTIGIVGTRRATTYGKDITRKIVEDLAPYDVQVISGMAYGIDISAHKAALDNHLSTIGVLAGGLDRVYPSVHRKYAESMQTDGAIVSESLPGTTPDAHLFPARNRIIAGMSDALIIVEAAEKGGALITARIADSYNRPLFAVPGHLNSEYSKGTNKLIDQQMALIYTGVESILNQLNWITSGETQAQKEVELSSLSDSEQKIIALLKNHGGPMEIDNLAIKSQIQINQLASLLLNLEFQNLIKSMPGKKYDLA